jgi:chromosome segregation ATPase
MPLSNGPSSLLEAQNRRLMKTASEKAVQIEKLESDLQRLREVTTQADRIDRELHSFQDELQRLRENLAQSNKLERELETRLERQIDQIERLTLEREFYSKRVLALEDDNRQLTEMATKYSLWGQKLERELARIDPDGAPARRFEAQQES